MNFKRGRFAPSPSGPLHFGSLIAALGSYLIAKTSGAKWLVRIEDIDPPREVKGASETILRQLEAFSLQWDDSVLYQSQRLDFYEHTLEDLRKQDLIYACDCTRKIIQQANRNNPSSNLYPNSCKNKQLAHSGNVALRLRHGAGAYGFDDLLQGTCQFSAELYREDFTLKRKDGLIAYQLAVVLDDIEQQIDHVVRGCDLLDSTPRQLRLYQVLQAKAPKFCHLPLILNQQGHKLSKQNHASEIAPESASDLLVRALGILRQVPSEQGLADDLSQLAPSHIIKWALEHFQFEKIPKIQQVKNPL